MEKMKKKQVKKCVAQLEPPPYANGHMNENDHFSVRDDANERSRTIKCVAPLEMT
jgi:hypothetical protein